jgi:hypothetical protein
MRTYPVLQECLALAVKERQARTWKEVHGERTCNSEREFAVSFFRPLRSYFVNHRSCLHFDKPIGIQELADKH